ncbi:MAG: sugar phosphate isomerase/epimerase [Oscillospiraceae bacterium]|nr:sugar phosphate isomerase/epimerase [Oscillospiraceae bacterium]
MRKNLNLGAQLYTVRQYMQNEKDYAQTIKKIADIGYKYVQVSGIGAGVTPAVIKRAAEDNNIKVILTHTPPGRIKDETEQVIADHDVFGCPGIGVGGMFGHPRTEDGYKRFAEDYSGAVQKIKDAGKVFLYHNHDFEFEKYNGKTGLDILLENTDKDAFKLTFDTYWAQFAGVDPADFIEKYGDRIFATHLKDMIIETDGKKDMTEIYTGIMDFGKIFEASNKTGVIWHFVEQDEVKIDAFESMRISHDNIMAKEYFK